MVSLNNEFHQKPAIYTRGQQGIHVLIRNSSLRIDIIPVCYVVQTVISIESLV